MKLSDLLHKRRKELRLSQAEMGAKVGVSKTTIGFWESDIVYPTQKHWDAISQHYGISLTHIDPLKDQGITVVDTPDDRRNVNVYELDTLIWRGGSDMIFGAALQEIACSSEYSTDCFAILIKDESMTGSEYGYRPGDMVFIDPHILPENGDDIIAGQLDKPALLRRYNSRGLDAQGFPAFDLQPLNPNFLTITANSEYPAKILGVVIEHRRFRQR